MKYVSQIQTYDGKIHQGHSDAVKHLEKLFSDRMCKVLERSRNLSNIEFGEWIEENLDTFQEMQRIKADQIIENQEDNDD